MRGQNEIRSSITAQLPFGYFTEEHRNFKIVCQLLATTRSLLLKRWIFRFTLNLVYMKISENHTSLRCEQPCTMLAGHPSTADEALHWMNCSVSHEFGG